VCPLERSGNPIRALAVLLLLLLAVPAAPRLARAFELRLPGRDRVLSVIFTQTLISEYHADTDALAGNDSERYFDLKNRSDLLLLHGATSLNLRFDATAFVGTLDGSPHQSRANLQKITLSSAQRFFDVTAGDFSVRVGRGLALDLTRVNEILRDTTLRGGSLTVRHRLINGTVFGGWANPLDVDDFLEVPVRRPSDVVGGARVEVTPIPLLKAGAHYVGAGLQALESTSRNATHVLGATLEFPDLFKRVNLYGEYDFMSRAQGLDIIQGHGTYLGATGNFGPLAVLLEFKFYSHLLFVNDFGSEVDFFYYNRPPTLTRTKAEVLNNHDVIGPRLRLDWRLQRTGTLFYVNYGHFYRSEAQPGQSFFDNGIMVYDAYGGLQQPLPGGALDLAGGYRVDKRGTPEGESITDYSCAFGEAELSMLVWRNHTLEAEVQFRKVQKGALAFSDFYLGLGYRPTRWVSAGFSYEYSNEYQDSDPNDTVGVRRHYGGVRATVSFTPASYARLFGGTTHGGVRCIDGFCREFPPFIGVKLELVVQL
jgi:hypothetical protein